MYLSGDEIIGDAFVVEIWTSLHKDFKLLLYTTRRIQLYIYTKNYISKMSVFTNAIQLSAIYL